MLSEIGLKLDGALVIVRAFAGGRGRRNQKPAWKMIDRKLIDPPAELTGKFSTYVIRPPIEARALPGLKYVTTL